MGYDIVDLWFKEIDYTNRISRQVYLEVDSSRTPVSESLEDIMSVLTGVALGEELDEYFLEGLLVDHTVGAFL